METRGRTPLLLGAAINFGIAVLHVAVMAAGAPAYRFFGAPSLADAVERGAALRPALLTLAIAAVLAAWGAYALSGAGMVRRLPFLRTALVAITAVYLLRGVLLAPELAALVQRKVKYPRALAFSVVALATGLCHLIGTIRRWKRLGGAG